MGLISRVSSRTYRDVSFKMAPKMPYVQEMPPKGGYPQIPYKRHIPKRGLTTAGSFAFACAAMWWNHLNIQEQKRIFKQCEMESQQSMTVWKPLLRAERERLQVVRKLNYHEQANMNLVATGIFPNLDPVRDMNGKWALWEEWSDGKPGTDHMGCEVTSQVNTMWQRMPECNTIYKHAVNADIQGLFTSSGEPHGP